MLLFIALLAMLLVVAGFRKPGIPFLTIVSFSNRQDKLTATGAKLYVAAAIMIVLGMLSLFSSPKSENSTGATTSRESADGQVDGDASIQTIADPDEKTAQFATLTRQFSISAETLASMMQTNGMAESRLELCNSFVEGGMTDWKADHQLHRLGIAVRDCHHIVLNLCREAGGEDVDRCSAYKERTSRFDFR